MKKYNILLDLDQTLIASEQVGKISTRSLANYKKMFESHTMPGEYVIFARPHLQSFLDFLFANFNVSVWTAASKDYALFIIEKFILIKPERKLDFFFYSYHTNLALKEHSKLKDISMLWRVFKLQNYNFKNTYIIDDNENVYEAQPKNTIRIKEFNYDSVSKEDGEFARIRLFLEKLR